MPAFDNLANEPALVFLLVFSAFLVGLSKGGLPAVAMLSVPLLSIFMSPLIAAVLLLPIYILSDIVGVYLYRREYSAINVKLLIPAGLFGVVIAWATASVVSDKVVSALIGGMGIVFCLHRWFNLKPDALPTRPSLPKGIFWGTLAGFTSFVAHAGGPPFQVYILPQNLPKMIFAGTATIVFAVINLAKIVPYYHLHPYNLQTLKTALFLLPVAAIGTVAGKLLTERLSTKWFFLLVQIALFLVSIRLVLSVF